MVKLILYMFCINLVIKEFVKSKPNFLMVQLPDDSETTGDKGKKRGKGKFHFHKNINFIEFPTKVPPPSQLDMKKITLTSGAELCQVQ